jgi:hypothetical protein
MRETRKMPCQYSRALLGAVAAGAVALAVAGAASAAGEEQKIFIESLLKSGWQIAGYTSAVDDRSTFILFRHPSESYLVQCRSGYDVTRSPRVYSNCYELR